MGHSENKLAGFLVACVVAFFLGCVLVLLANFPFLGDPFAMMSAGIVLMILSFAVGIVGFLMFVTARNAAKTKSRAGPRRRVAARIHSVWRTDRGRVVDAYTTELDRPCYHAVLVSDDGKRIEVDTDSSIWQECIEGSWGWAEVQGDWLGAYQRDAELYRKYTGR